MFAAILFVLLQILPPQGLHIVVDVTEAVTSMVSVANERNVVEVLGAQSYINGLPEPVFHVPYLDERHVPLYANPGAPLCDFTLLWNNPTNVEASEAITYKDGQQSACGFNSFGAFGTLMPTQDNTRLVNMALRDGAPVPDVWHMIITASSAQDVRQNMRSAVNIFELFEEEYGDSIQRPIIVSNVQCTDNCLDVMVELNKQVITNPRVHSAYWPADTLVTPAYDLTDLGSAFVSLNHPTFLAGVQVQQ